MANNIHNIISVTNTAKLIDHGAIHRIASRIFPLSCGVLAVIGGEHRADVVLGHSPSGDNFNYFVECMQQGELATKVEFVYPVN